MPFAWLWLLPSDMKSFSQSLVAVSFFSSNFLFCMTSGYYENAAELNPLLHTWSLAVEEQYYVLFPMFLLLTWRIGKCRILAIISVVFIISLSLAQWGAYRYPNFAFYLLPSRGWELLIGVLISFYLSAEAKGKLISQSVSQLVSIIGLLLITYAIFAFDKKTPFPSLYSLIPTIGAAIIILYANSDTLVGKLLGSKLFVGIGLISYSAYLWHQPIFSFARQRSLGETSSLLLSALAIGSFILAYLSWRYVETPFRSSIRVNRHHIVIVATLGSFICCVFGLIGHLNNGYRKRIPIATEIAGIELPRIDNGWCFYHVEGISDLALGSKGLDCFLGDKSSDIKGVLFGDSYAGQYEPLWDGVGRSANVRINSISTNFCYPSVNEDFTGPKSGRSFQQCIYNRKYFVDNILSFDFVILGGQWGVVLDQDKMAGVFDLIDFIAPRVKLVIVMSSPKQFDQNIMLNYRKSIFFSEPFDITKFSNRNDKSAAEANSLLQVKSKQYKNVLFVDRSALFSINGKLSDVTSENFPFSLDGGHISVYGSQSTVGSFLSSDIYSDIKRYFIFLRK